MVYQRRPGDLICTGTLEGVVAVQWGDRIEARAAGVGSIVWHVGAAE